MQEKIGQAAGAVWQYLAQSQEPVSLATLAKKADLNSQTAAMAIGWLARENKLVFQEKGKTLLVSLASACTC
ncbi:MAG TPA: winged helix-turn-helix domain-containing protein [Anaerohalosphaeraceae bacterium]|nr:winged helix-turn-helix domain-containing protein [Anaerohalosphaeraceae bacterium]